MKFKDGTVSMTRLTNETGISRTTTAMQRDANSDTQQRRLFFLPQQPNQCLLCSSHTSPFWFKRFQHYYQRPNCHIATRRSILLHVSLQSVRNNWKQPNDSAAWFVFVIFVYINLRTLQCAMLPAWKHTEISTRQCRKVCLCHLAPSSRWLK